MCRSSKPWPILGQHVAVAAGQHDRDVELTAPDLLAKLQTRHAGHDDVGKHVEPPVGLQWNDTVGSTLTTDPKINTGRADMAAKTLDDLFHDTLRDIYYAEKQILKALPKMARGAQSPDLKAAFEKHKGETEGQVDRLEQVFAIIDKKPRGKKCEAIEGILAEGDEVLEDFKGSPALDAGLISSAQAVKHYEITRYGTLKRWATVLGLTDAAALLDETLQQEGATDEGLTALSDTANQTAIGGVA